MLSKTFDFKTIFDGVRVPELAFDRVGQIC